ncbi:serine hydrolase [Streptomyces albidoflavus]|uniref:serine hydrolase n=1 Tax=Streptomyces albidoflavus TaxID=1886 RepID=UPI003BF5FA25
MELWAGSATGGSAASGIRRRWSPSSPAPRASSGHGHVFGFLAGEVVRRITGLTPGRFFREAIDEPLGLRAWIGLPAVGLDEPHGFNDPELLGTELPGAGAVASASGLAALYGAAVTGLDGGPRLLSEETLTDAVREVSAGPTWQGYDLGQRWGSGFLLDSERPRPRLGARSFGNDGAGGQFAFGDDEFGVGFAYVANRMIGHGDDRANRLITALRESLKA